MDLEINNQKDFYDKVRINQDGELQTVVVPKTGEATVAENAYNFFKRIALDENGKIKTVSFAPTTPPKVFTIAKSFLLDGVDEYFDVELPQIGGAGKRFTNSFMIKRNSLGVRHGLLTSLDVTGQVYYRFDAANNLVLNMNNGTIARVVTFSNVFNSTSDWYFINVVYDSTLSSGNRTEMYINGVLANKTADASDTMLRATTNYTLGKTVIDEFDGLINHFSVIDKPLTATEIATYYNSGLPLSPTSEFSSDCSYFFNPENGVFDGSNWEVENQGITATSVNMEDADKTTDNPYS